MLALPGFASLGFGRSTFAPLGTRMASRPSDGRRCWLRPLLASTCSVPSDALSVLPTLPAPLRAAGFGFTLARITVRPSRTRFAGRLNSGVRRRRKQCSYLKKNSASSHFSRRCLQAPRFAPYVVRRAARPVGACYWWLGHGPPRLCWCCFCWSSGAPRSQALPAVQVRPRVALHFYQATGAHDPVRAERLTVHSSRTRFAGRLNSGVMRG